jgi:hypothetical protein
MNTPKKIAAQSMETFAGGSSQENAENHGSGGRHLDKPTLSVGAAGATACRSARRLDG